MSTIAQHSSMSTYKAMAVSRASPSIVTLTYYAGSGTRVGNGIIFSCVRDDDHHQFMSYILTTNHLFGASLREREQGVASKIDVCVSTHQLYGGEVMVCDLDMYIVIVKIKSDDALPVATLTPFSDCISLAPFGVPESCPSPSPTKLIPGDEVTIVCRETENVLVKTGIHSLDYIPGFSDQKPFFRVNCQEDIIDGAPVINCEGDVIGVAFSVPRVCVAFLPVNIFIKWWKHVLEYGEICRPRLGMTFTSLYAAHFSFIENVVLDCDVYDGVIIDQLFNNFPADSAGLCRFDVISQCDGRPVRSLLEFFEFMWDKAGKVFEAKGVSRGCHSVWKVEILAIKASLIPQILADAFSVNAAAKKKRGKNKKVRWDISKCSGIRKKVAEKKGR